MGDMGGGGVKNLKKVRDILCERPHTSYLDPVWRKIYDGDGDIWVILYTYYDYKTVINPRSDILNNARVHFPCISNYNYILLLLKNYFQIISQRIVVFHLEFLSSNLLWPELPHFIHDFNQVSF